MDLNQLLSIIIFIIINSFQTLIDLGANIDLQTGSDNDTALFFAAYYNYREVVVTLLENGADPNIKDSDGWTALDYSIYYNYRRISKILASYGAEATVE